MASFSKGKTGGNTPIGFRTPDFMKQSRFSGGKTAFGGAKAVQKGVVKQIRVTQHKGGS